MRTPGAHPSPAERDDGAEVLALLGMLADGASLGEIAAAAAPPEARELALKVAGSREISHRREAGLTALLDSARELVTESDPANVLDAIVRRARALLGADLTYLTLHDPERGDTFMRATEGSVSAAFQSVRLEAGAGLGGLVASTRKPYWTADYWNDDRFQHTRDIDGAVSEEGIVAICGTPLIVDNTFVGVLFAAYRSARPFTHEEVGLLGNLATLAAVTLVQTRALADAEAALAALSEAHETVRRHTAGVERAAAAHDRFASIVLGGGGVEDLTRALVDLLGGWAALVDIDGSTRGATPGTHVPRRFPEVSTADRLVHEDGVYGVVVAAGDERLGTLFLGDVGRLDEADRRMVERAGMVTALVLLLERQAVDTLQSARSRTLASLLNGRGPSEERLQLARSAGLQPEQPHCLLVLRPDPATSPRALVLSAGSALGEGSLVGTLDGDVVALVQHDAPGRLAETVAGRLRRRTSATVAGVGPLVGVEGLQEAHREARRTASALIALGQGGRGAAATGLGFAGLIVGNDPDVADYVQRQLGPLLDYDRRRRTDLVGTLDAYFAAGRSPRHAATCLHVHVNTVTQRLERITRLLDEEWQSPERSLELQLALHLRRLLGERD